MNSIGFGLIEGKIDETPYPDNADEEFIKVVDELWEYVVELDPESVCINLECCSHFTTTWMSNMNRLLRKLLDRGHLIMVSDFALKGLIKNWEEEHLGPKAFIQVGKTGSPIHLRFLSYQLLECASAQLQKVAELCENGEAELHTLSGTILYGLNPNRETTDIYQVEVLTVAVEDYGLQDSGDENDDPKTRLNNCLVELGDHRGLPSHVALHYSNGGILLVSSGHWIELSKLDVSEAAFHQIAMGYGSGYYETVTTELNGYSGEEKKSKMQSYAATFVQQSAPAKYSKKKVQSKSQTQDY